jgi:hypothetical protein
MESVWCIIIKNTCFEHKEWGIGNLKICQGEHDTSSKSSSPWNNRFPWMQSLCKIA